MRNASFAEKLFVILSSWLVPGFGFFLYGRRARGLLFFFLLQGIFLVGVFLKGSVLLPDFNPAAEGFNLVTILTFVTQIFNGGLAIISLLPEFAGPHFAIFPSNEAAPLADLGSFLLLVSGGMNYFVTVNTYDHFYGRKSQLASSAGTTVEEESIG
jgi:hypothetical protein